MPVVPDTTFEQRVMPQGQGAYNTIDRATPESFGGQVGQTLQQAGNMLQQHAVARQQIINAANVDDVYANQFDPAFRQKYMDFLKLKGKDAETAFPEFQRDMHDLLTDTAAGLPNAQQQHTFNEVARRRMMSDLDGMARHAASETNNWIASTTDASGGVYMNRIVDNRNNPDKVQGFINNINNLYTAQGQMFGQDPVVYKAKAANVIDFGINRAINTELEVSPENARALFDKYSPYLSNDGVRADIQNRIQPKLARKQQSDVYGYVYNYFGVGNPDSDINAATRDVMDPNKYTQLTNEQRNEVAHTLSAEWNRTRKVRNDTQKTANDNFELGILNGTITGEQALNWTDQKTGVGADSMTVRKGLEWLANPITTNKSNPGILTGLTDDVSNRQAVDPAPLNSAYMQGQISENDWKDLRKLQEIMQDRTKSGWFSFAEQLYKSRYLHSDTGRLSDAARQMFPQYISNLDQNIREQNLKGQQIWDMAKKMLEPVDKAIVSHWYGDRFEPQPALDFATQWGGWPKPVINQPAVTPTATPAPAPNTAPSPDQAGPAWTRNYLVRINQQNAKNGLPPIPLTDANVKAAQDHFKSQDAQYWKNWTLKGD